MSIGAAGNKVGVLLLLLSTSCAHTKPVEEPRFSSPRDDRGRMLTGVVGLELSIDAEGNVIDVVVVSSGGSKLDAAAREVALKLKFAPTGRPATMRYNVEFGNERHPPEGTPDPA